MSQGAADAYTHTITRTFFFLRVWWPLHMCVWVFPRPCFAAHRLPINRGEAEVHRMGWVWKRGREEKERSWACSHRPDSWLRAHNKDPCTGAWHPSGWSRHMSKHTWIENTYDDACAQTRSDTLARTICNISMFLCLQKSLKAKNKLIFSHLFAYYTNNNTKVLSSSAFFLFIKCLLFLVHHNHTHIQMCLDACLIRVLRPREHRSVLCTWTWTLRIPVMNLNFKNTEGGSTHIYKRQPRMTQCLSLWQSRKKTNIKGWWCTRGWT